LVALATLSAPACFRATVAYDGTDFSGFQVQVFDDRRPIRHAPSARRTVQGTLEKALQQVTGQPVRLRAAGRTDAGVHALGQVVAFAAHWSHSLADLHRAWNAVLPDDVAILSLCQARQGFHPRFDATSRIYRYVIWNHPVRNPLLRRTVLWVRRPLDLAPMRAALDLLIGEHDFATFGTAPMRARLTSRSVRPTSRSVRPNPPAPTVRRVLAVHCACADGHTADAAFDRPDGYHRLIYLDIEANAFLYRMVRSIVGTVLQVGLGQLSLAQFASLFAAADRSRAGPTAPPHGLCLIAVNYQNSEEYPSENLCC
jgi:tRNA pseudouridine38-40 synthase